MENNDIFIAVRWPDVQDLMDKPGFVENSILINSYPLLEEYESSAYMVRQSWLLDSDECDASEVDLY